MTLEEYWKKTGSKKKFIRRNLEGKGMNKGVEHWIAPNDKILRNTLWQDVFASKVPQGFNVPFNNPKNPELIKLLIEIALGDLTKGIVLDFFGGSGSTAHAVLDYNADKGTDLQFITVQLAEKIDESDEAYSLGHRFISDVTRNRIKDVINFHKSKSKDTSHNTDARQLGFRAFKLSGSNFKVWRGDMIQSEQDLVLQTSLFQQPVKGTPTHYSLLWELLIKDEAFNYRY